MRERQTEIETDFENLEGEKYIHFHLHLYGRLLSIF